MFEQYTKRGYNKMKTITLERNGKKTAYGQHGHLSVSGKNMVDANGNIVQLRGISTHNLSSYPEYVCNECFTSLVDNYDVTVMRLAMYSAVADGDNGYSDGDDAHRDELEKLILSGVQTCAELGIYCIVDWHILFDYDPNMNIDMAIKFWKKLCPILKEYDNVIIEICNEPNMNFDTGYKVTWDEISVFANKVIPVIKEIDDSKIIVVGTPTWSQDVDIASNSPLKYDNIMYTLHFYADTHRDEVRDKAKYALSKNLPIFVTEFGVGDALGDGIINDEQSDIWIKLLNDNSISYVIWNLSNKAETSSIIKADCTKLGAFTDDDLTESGKRMKKYMNI